MNLEAKLAASEKARAEAVPQDYRKEVEAGVWIEAAKQAEFHGFFTLGTEFRAAALRGGK